MKYDKSDLGIFICVICRKVLVFNSPSPPEKLRIYAPGYSNLCSVPGSIKGLQDGHLLQDILCPGTFSG